VAFLSVYERIERMQEKDPDKMYCGNFSVYHKSGGNLPPRKTPRVTKLRVMTSPEDE
jgi:hypothetical protein